MRVWGGGAHLLLVVLLELHPLLLVLHVHGGHDAPLLRQRPAQVLQVPLLLLQRALQTRHRRLSRHQLTHTHTHTHLLKTLKNWETNVRQNEKQ